MSVLAPFQLLYVQIIFSSVPVAEMLSFGKELLTRLTVFQMFICNLSYFPFLVLKAESVFDCTSSWSLLIF